MRSTSINGKRHPYLRPENWLKASKCAFWLREDSNQSEKGKEYLTKWAQEMNEKNNRASAR